MKWHTYITIAIFPDVGTLKIYNDTLHPPPCILSCWKWSCDLTTYFIPITQIYNFGTNAISEYYILTIIYLFIMW